MATSKSGKKSVKQAEARRVFNVRRLRAMKSSVKQVNEFVLGKDKQSAQQALPQAFKSIDKAAKRGIIKKKNAARKKSRLAKAIANA
ncbi:30S ribosomal protein S20 [bacterium]|nr:30S ribosomal protein S20 [bacterium]|tara:strand:- start:7245 stop:7505 length:261 start_codon:yes stop_codon:yes gene_type:complete